MPMPSAHCGPPLAIYAEISKPFELDSFLDTVAGLLTERDSESYLEEAV